MTPLQIRAVQESFALVVPDRELVAQQFYARLFEIAPELRPMFTRDLASQGRKLMNVLKLVVHSLENIGGLVPFIAEMGQRHRGYGVLDAHYDLVGQALIWTLEQGLGEAFTDHHRGSWLAAYDLLASTMKQGTVSAQCA